MTGPPHTQGSVVVVVVGAGMSRAFTPPQGLGVPRSDGGP